MIVYALFVIVIVVRTKLLFCVVFCMVFCLVSMFINPLLHLLQPKEIAYILCYRNWDIQTQKFSVPIVVQLYPKPKQGSDDGT